MKQDKLFIEALDYATEMHIDQTRKNSGEPYIFHPIEVSQIVWAFTEDLNTAIAAILHDTVEDTTATEKDIQDRFGFRIATLVMAVSKVSTLKDQDGNPVSRADRKEADRIHFSSGDADAQNIKLADVISNGSGDHVKYAPKFAKMYFQEQLDLVHSLTEGNTQLWQLALETVHQNIEQLGENDEL